MWHFKQEQLGFYLQDQLTIDKWTFIGGARYDHVKTTNEVESSGKTEKRNDYATTLRLGGLYAFDVGLSPYVSYSESFQPPSSLGAADFKLNDPMEGQQLEVGLKYQIPDTRTLFTASVFRTEQKNVVEMLPDRSTRQTGKVRVNGLELEAKTSFDNGFDFIANSTIMSSRILSSDDDMDNQGNRMANTPKFSAAMWADYTQQDGPLVGLGGGLGVRYMGTVHATNKNELESEVYKDEVISDKVPYYIVADAALHYDLAQVPPSLENFQVAFNVQNLFDKKYVAQCGGAQYCNYGYGREFTASVNYHWD